MMPDIPDTWRGSIGEAAKVLGICRETMRKYIALGVRQGGIAVKISPLNGRKVITGKAIKSFWLRSCI